jgi:tetratricopeptide (TPR) repeat protein
MDYADIMREVTDGLTGDWERDRAYLNRKTQEYKDHPCGFEVARGIGRLLCEIMPPDVRHEVELAVDNDARLTRAILAEARQKLSDGALDEAETLLRGVLPHERLFQEDAVSVYYSFRNPLELTFFVNKFRPEKTVRIPPYPFNEIYELQAYILIERQRWDDARGVIDEALKRNPLLGSILFEKGEIDKRLKDLDQFLRTTVSCLGLCYRRVEMARYFRNLGYYFIEREQWDEAIYSYLVSLSWQQSQMAQSQLYYITQRTGRLIRPEEYKGGSELLAKHAIPLSPDPLWAQSAWWLAEQSVQEKQFDLACLGYEVVYELTGDPEAREKLAQCEAEADVPEPQRRGEVAVRRGTSRRTSRSSRPATRRKTSPDETPPTA